MEKDDEQHSKELAEQGWRFRLYVAGRTPKCLRAIENLEKFCKEYLIQGYTVEVIDLLESPALAKEDQIIAIPTLVRRYPEPLRKLVGDLSNTERMLHGFDMKPK